MKPERKVMFEKLLALCEEYKRVNQYVWTKVDVGKGEFLGVFRILLRWINWVDFCHNSAKQTSLMALAAPKIENFVKNFWEFCLVELRILFNFALDNKCEVWRHLSNEQARCIRFAQTLPTK